MDNVTDVSAPIATLEPDYWRLDGTFILPLPPGRSNTQVGFWSAAMSDDTGAFSAKPSITVEFSETQNIKEFGAAFDGPSGNYCEELTFEAWDSYGASVYSELITDNASAYGRSAGGAEGVKKLRITFDHTNNPSRYLRVSEINFGIVVNFDGEDILDLSLTTEGDPTGGSFPFPRLSLSVENGGRFDTLDKESFAGYLYARQPFEYDHGLVLPGGAVEWAYCGAYYLQDYEISDDTVSFVCGGKSSVTEDAAYSGSSLAEKTLGAFIEETLAGAGFDAYIAPALYNSPVITCWAGGVSYRDAFAMLTEASCCLSFESKENVIQFVDIINAGAPAGVMDYENLLRRPRVKQEPYYNGVMLAEYAASADGSGGVRFERSETFYAAPWRDPFEPDYPYSVDLPMMIVTAKYPAFRAWFLQRKFALLRKRLSCECDWLGNPALSVGDTVTLQASESGSARDMILVRSGVEYARGVLRGSAKVIGDGL
jgi:hypothetical protein